MATSIDSCSDIEDSEVDSVTESFNRASEHVKKLVSNLEPPKLLEIYSYYKQSTEGPCNIPRPKWYEMQAKAKWDAWNQLGDMPSDEAKKNYVKIIAALDPDFSVDDSTINKADSWITVSSLLNTDEILKETDKTVFDFVKEGEIDKLKVVFENNSDILELKDEEGLGLIHWAADRGNIDILKYLIRLKIDVNLKDNEGQTALHYASSCDHLDCVKFLIESGANIQELDSEGCKAIDLTNDEKIIELLNKM